MINKLFIIFLYVLIAFFNPLTVLAKSNVFVSIVNPIRGNDFKERKEQKIEEVVLGQIKILDDFNLPASWLIRFDVLDEDKVISQIKSRAADEKGLFLEVTPSWSGQAGVEYQAGANWHDAAAAFLTGYEREERLKLIDKAFEKFKGVFGYYPLSVGAWWIDSFSLDYMQKKYQINAALIVSDQYSTDNYQIWGQYFSTPYYPSNKNALNPAQTIESKLPIVVMQWAARDPVNAYGNGVQESTYSVQSNDYLDFHNLDSNYFSSLVDIYTKQQFNLFGHLVIGLENSYSWSMYSNEYKNQIQILSDKKKTGQLNIVTMNNFAKWYKDSFPNLSPTHLIVADDPLGSYKKVVWFMNPYYRAGWFYNQEGSLFRDVRQYIDGDEEICFQRRCDFVNFATFATRVLDEVTYGSHWLLDEGRISDFKVTKKADDFTISYINEAGNIRTIELMPRDISVDGKISSIDGAILSATKQDKLEQKKTVELKETYFSWTFWGVVLKVIKFSLFLIFACLVPGLVMVNRMEKSFARRIFYSLIIGFVSITLIFYITSLLKIRYLAYVYLLLGFLLFLKFKLFSSFKFKFTKLKLLNLFLLLMIVAGTYFQNIPTFRSGLSFSYGLGFWGPNTHDGIWHLSLIKQLVKGLPVQNPIFSNTTLFNYHFFYDLLVAATAFFTKLPILDLVFRFYPILFSICLGIGTYLFTNTILKNKLAAVFSLYFVYFAGSFGWIADYIKNKSFGGESAFWANQSISFNLNPPFAISLLIIIVIFNVLSTRKVKFIEEKLITAMLIGSLIGFKAYGSVLILASLLFVAIIKLLKKDFLYIITFALSLVLSAIIFLLNFQPSKQLIIFSPFWLVHSMIDSPDRIGWTRLSLARIAGLQTKNWFKFISAETIGLMVFILGNLGIRVLSLLFLLRFKRILGNVYFLFLFIFCLLSLLIPLLFIQSANPWNIVQFVYYGLYISAVVSGVVLYSLIYRLPKVFSFIFLAVIIILTPINSFTTASYYTGELPHAIVDLNEVQALNFLSKQEDGAVLTYPYDKKLQRKIAEPWPLFAYDSTAYVSALSGKATYLEDEPQNQILLTEYKKRLVASKDFFSNDGYQGKKFLDNNNIRYIYLLKIFNIRLDEKQLAIENIYENDGVVIYRVK